MAAGRFALQEVLLQTDLSPALDVPVPALGLMHSGVFQDATDLNPLIRALAVRTMGCIRVDKISEYLCDPLRKSLKVRGIFDECASAVFWTETLRSWQDEDPYVRKTAAICVAKLFDINPELVEDQGFINSLNDMLSDSNPMVRLCTTLA